METSDIISLSIALYAALVSTLLAIIKIRSNSKILKIVIDYVYFYETAYLRLINQSARPITIASIAMQTDRESVPSNCMFIPDEGEIRFPKMVPEYSSIQLHLEVVLSTYILQEKARNLSIQVFDIDGKVYSKYKIRGINGKWGDVDKEIFKT